MMMLRDHDISIHALREEGDNLPDHSLTPSPYFYPRPPRGGRQADPLWRPPHKEFLSTPSARRATLYSFIRDGYAVFLSTPSARRATQSGFPRRHSWKNFYPRPPRGGRLRYYGLPTERVAFLSTPSARRATICLTIRLHHRHISIHALREEGDKLTLYGDPRTKNFYPRPPRGGRPCTVLSEMVTPYFYPRPPRGGRLNLDSRAVIAGKISIHALREEGDYATTDCRLKEWHFYPRPPRGGRHLVIGLDLVDALISIHALREEGDKERDNMSEKEKIFLSTPSARRATAAG